MTTARFTWGWHKRLTNRISSLFRTVRTPRSSRQSTQNDDDDDDNTTGIHPLSGIVAVGRHKSATACLPGLEMRGKAKQRTSRSVILRNDSTPNMGRRREKSIERWARSAANASSRDPNSNSVGRRGSETLIPPGEVHPHSMVNFSRSVGSQSRPSSRGRDSPSTPLPNDECSRHRFSLSSMWRPHSSRKTASQASSPLDSSSGVSIFQDNTLKPGPSVDIIARRSDEVLRHHGKEYSRSVHHNHGVLTAARRASSWGEPINYVEDVTSLNSGEQDGIDDDAMFLGAGGVEHTTIVSNLPFGLNQATEAINHASTVLRHPQPERPHLGPSVHICCDVCHLDSAPNRHHRSPTSPSPLHHVAYESDLNHTSEEEYEDPDSDYSFFRDTRREHEREAFHANASRMYDDEDDEESDEEMVPIEFKRRRPSVSVTAASPPPLSDPSDDGNS